MKTPVVKQKKWIREYISLDEAIRDIFGSRRIINTKMSISGGDINEAYLVQLDDGTKLFMKANTLRFLPCFEAEAEGLELIRMTGAIGVPAVLGMGIDGNTSFLLLEYISGERPVRDYWETFAAELAAMHQADTVS